MKDLCPQENSFSPIHLVILCVFFSNLFSGILRNNNVSPDFNEVVDNRVRRVVFPYVGDMINK